MSARDLVEKDYYAVLGVAKDAPAADIKKAYRKLARQLHPDANPGDAAAEGRFKEVSEAYDVLSDPQRRREYDEARALFASGGPGGFGGGMPGGMPGGTEFDLGDLLGRFGGAGAGGGPGATGGFGSIFDGLLGRGGGARPGRRGQDIEATVTVSFEDALAGLETSVRLPGAAACDTCGGSGARPGSAPRACPQCGGAGVVSHSQGPFALSEPCRDCRGRGMLIDDPCPGCRGSGRRERVQKIRIPAGVQDGQKLRVRGRGRPGTSGGPAGDLTVTVQVTPHQVFGRDGANLTLTVPITYTEAVLGAGVRVPTPDAGPVTVKVPAGSRHGQKLRVRGRGAGLKGGGRGDLIVTLEIAVPAKVSAAAQAALKTFDEAIGEAPRAYLDKWLDQ